MSQTKEENGQASLTKVISETEETTVEEAPEDEVDSQEEEEEDTQEEEEDTEEEDDVDSEEEDMEGSEEHHQSEIEELVKPTPVEPKKTDKKQRPTSVEPKKTEKKQRPTSVEPKKQFVDDVPKEQPKKLKTTEKGEEDVPANDCCCKVPWARWEELVISYLHVIIAVSSGLAGAGLSSIVETFEDTFQANRTLNQPTYLNSTDCPSNVYLSDSIEIIVTVIYTVIFALFLAQAITLIVLGTQRKYVHVEFVFVNLRGLITLFTTVYFIVGWSGALGCVTLNILAIVTTMIEVALRFVEWFHQAKKLGREFVKDCCPQELSPDNEESLDVM